MNQLELTGTMTRKRLVEIAKMVLDTYKIKDWRQYYICWRLGDLITDGIIDEQEAEESIYSLFYMLPYQHRMEMKRNHDGEITDYPWFEDDDKESRIELLNELIKACENG